MPFITPWLISGTGLTDNTVHCTLLFLQDCILQILLVFRMTHNPNLKKTRTDNYIHYLRSAYGTQNK